MDATQLNNRLFVSLENMSFSNLNVINFQRKTIKTSEDPTIIENLKEIRRRLLAKSHTKPGLWKGRKLSKFVNDEQSKIMASMLPDEVLTHSNYEPRNFEGVLFFADISGFTEVSEKYQSIPNGASKMSQVVNFYIGTMVQEILSHGGDVIKYSGDAYIAIFKVTPELSYQEVVSNTLDTAILIQKNCRNYRTDVGVFFNVKIAIAVGLVHFSAIGNEHSSHYVLVGEPLWKVKSLEKLTNPGEILITQKTWNYAQKELYSQEYQSDRKCHKLIDFKDTMGGIQRQYGLKSSY
jgi:class 3 adenylate cyclase